jgi:hypothetical protein
MDLYICLTNFKNFIKIFKIKHWRYKMNKKLIFVLILLIILITFNFYFINAENTKNSVIAKKNDNIEYIILRPPWDFTKYYLHPSTYDNHKEGTKDKAVDFYFKPDYNKPNIYIYMKERVSQVLKFYLQIKVKFILIYMYNLQKMKTNIKEENGMIFK